MISSSHPRLAGLWTLRRLAWLAALLAAACCPPGALLGAVEPSALAVFAAASLTEVFSEVGDAFSREPGSCAVTFNFGASNNLRLQLEQGARADVFATANQMEMERAAESGLVEPEPKLFACNQLAVMVPRASPLEGFLDLSKPGLKVVLAHRDVPAGSFALQFLDAVDRQSGQAPGFKASVLANVVSYETTVKQVVAKVRLGEADAGVVYATDATPSNSSAIRLLAIPERFNVVTRLPAAVVTGAAHPRAARRFVEFLGSAAAQACLRRHGFLEPR